MGGYLYSLAVVGAILLPVIWSAMLILLALRRGESKRTANWPVYLHRIRAFNLLAVPAWWSIFDALHQVGKNRDPISDWPTWILFIMPLTVGTGGARLLTLWADSKVSGRRWSVSDLLRLAFAATLSLTVPLLAFALGIDAIQQRNLLGSLWLGFAGVLALEGNGLLNAASGMKPHLVKSGELFKQSFAMAKRMGVSLIGVFVYPAGRGRLMNAHGGAGFIGMTDICVHRLHGPQLDFIIAHELTHVQRNDRRKTVRTAGSIYFTVAAIALIVPALPLVLQVLLKFAAILIPLFLANFVARRFEFACDRAAVELTGDGVAAIKALATISSESGVLRKRSTFDELLSTHPSLRRRIDRIARVRKVPLELVAEILEQFNERVDDLRLPIPPA